MLPDLKSKRKALNLTIREASEKIGCYEQQLWAYENNMLDIPAKHLVRVSKVLKIPLNDLIAATVQNKTTKILKGIK